jgi:hypothetical protein
MNDFHSANHFGIGNLTRCDILDVVDFLTCEHCITYISFFNKKEHTMPCLFGQHKKEEGKDTQNP